MIHFTTYFLLIPFAAGAATGWLGHKAFLRAAYRTQKRIRRIQHGR